MTVDLPFYTPGANSLLWNLLWGRKEGWYHDLIAETRKTGYTPTLITVEMGSRGLPNMLWFQRLSTTCSRVLWTVIECITARITDHIRSGVLGTTLQARSLIFLKGGSKIKGGTKVLPKIFAN